MSKNEQLNQTQFAFEEPISQDFNVEIPVEKIEEKPEEPKSKKKLFIIIGIASFLLLLIVLIIASRMGKKTIEKIEPDFVPTTSEELSPIMIRIEKAKVALEEADPTKQDLVFPPIDMNLRLDEKPR